eukprot:scpid14716/ scgid0118/ 
MDICSFRSSFRFKCGEWMGKKECVYLMTLGDDSKWTGTSGKPILEKDLIRNRAGILDMPAAVLKTLTICPKHRYFYLWEFPMARVKKCHYRFHPKDEPIHLVHAQIQAPYVVTQKMSNRMFRTRREHGPLLPISDPRRITHPSYLPIGAILCGSCEARLQRLKPTVVQKPQVQQIGRYSPRKLPGWLMDHEVALTNGLLTPFDMDGLKAAIEVEREWRRGFTSSSSSSEESTSADGATNDESEAPFGTQAKAGDSDNDSTDTGTEEDESEGSQQMPSTQDQPKEATVLRGILKKTPSAETKEADTKTQDGEPMVKKKKTLRFTLPEDEEEKKSKVVVEKASQQSALTKSNIAPTKSKQNPSTTTRGLNAAKPGKATTQPGQSKANMSQAKANGGKSVAGRRKVEEVEEEDNAFKISTDVARGGKVKVLTPMQEKAIAFVTRYGCAKKIMRIRRLPPSPEIKRDSPSNSKSGEGRDSGGRSDSSGSSGTSDNSGSSDSSDSNDPTTLSSTTSKDPKTAKDTAAAGTVSNNKPGQQSKQTKKKVGGKQPMPTGEQARNTAAINKIQEKQKSKVAVQDDKNLQTRKKVKQTTLAEKGSEANLDVQNQNQKAHHQKKSTTAQPGNEKNNEKAKDMNNSKEPGKDEEADTNKKQEQEMANTGAATNMDDNRLVKVTVTATGIDTEMTSASTGLENLPQPSGAVIQPGTETLQHQTESKTIANTNDTASAEHEHKEKPKATGLDSDRNTEAQKLTMHKATGADDEIRPEEPHGEKKSESDGATRKGEAEPDRDLQMAGPDRESENNAAKLKKKPEAAEINSQTHVREPLRQEAPSTTAGITPVNADERASSQGKPQNRTPTEKDGARSQLATQTTTDEKERGTDVRKSTNEQKMTATKSEGDIEAPAAAEKENSTGVNIDTDQKKPKRKKKPKASGMDTEAGQSVPQQKSNNSDPLPQDRSNGKTIAVEEDGKKNAEQKNSMSDKQSVAAVDGIAMKIRAKRAKAKRQLDSDEELRMLLDNPAHRYPEFQEDFLYNVSHIVHDRKMSNGRKEFVRRREEYININHEFHETDLESEESDVSFVCIPAKRRKAKTTGQSMARRDNYKKFLKVSKIKHGEDVTALRWIIDRHTKPRRGPDPECLGKERIAFCHCRKHWFYNAKNAHLWDEWDIDFKEGTPRDDYVNADDLMDEELLEAFHMDKATLGHLEREPRYTVPFWPAKMYDLNRKNELKYLDELTADDPAEEVQLLGFLHPWFEGFGKKKKKKDPDDSEEDDVSAKSSANNPDVKSGSSRPESPLLPSPTLSECDSILGTDRALVGSADKSSDASSTPFPSDSSGDDRGHTFRRWKQGTRQLDDVVKQEYALAGDLGARPSAKRSAWGKVNVQQVLKIPGKILADRRRSTELRKPAEQGAAANPPPSGKPKPPTTLRPTRTTKPSSTPKLPPPTVTPAARKPPSRKQPSSTPKPTPKTKPRPPTTLSPSRQPEPKPKHIGSSISTPNRAASSVPSKLARPSKTRNLPKQAVASYQPKLLGSQKTKRQQKARTSKKKTWAV